MDSVGPSRFSLTHDSCMDNPVEYVCETAAAAAAKGSAGFFSRRLLARDASD